MKKYLKGFVILALFFSQITFALQASYHQRDNSRPPTAAHDKVSIFGGCYIEVINDSFSNVTVYGRYDDGIPLIPFDVYSYEYSHLIDMFYDGYCHSGMYLSIVTFSGYAIFSGYVFTGSSLHVVPGLSGKVALELTRAKE